MKALKAFGAILGILAILLLMPWVMAYTEKYMLWVFFFVNPVR